MTNMQCKPSLAIPFRSSYLGLLIAIGIYGIYSLPVSAQTDVQTEVQIQAPRN